MSFFGAAETADNYIVIETDYTTFSVVYSCSPDDKQFLYFLTRDNVISNTLYD